MYSDWAWKTALESAQYAWTLKYLSNIILIVCDIYSGSKNYSSSFSSSFLSFFCALWKPTSELLLATFCSTLCLVYMLLVQLCISFNLHFPKTRKDTHEFFITKNYPSRQRKRGLCLLKNLLILKKISRIFWSILVEISRTFRMNINIKLYC